MSRWTETQKVFDWAEESDDDTDEALQWLFGLEREGYIALGGYIYDEEVPPEEEER